MLCVCSHSFINLILVVSVGADLNPRKEKLEDNFPNREPSVPPSKQGCTSLSLQSQHYNQCLALYPLYKTMYHNTISTLYPLMTLLSQFCIYHANVKQVIGLSTCITLLELCVSLVLFASLIHYFYSTLILYLPHSYSTITPLHANHNPVLSLQLSRRLFGFIYKNSFLISTQSYPHSDVNNC